MNKNWWKEVVVYQIYPRSFKDSNGDGIGDLQGIIEKLDYLTELGIDVLWLSPIYQSPNDDNGYDIADYQAIMDEFGTMEDFDRLLTKAHQRGLRIIMDLVINHTSDEHPWFLESRSSKDNPKRDYYIWRPPINGKEPNNWLSRFSGSAWERDEKTGEYYLHLYSRKQPDLNWRNPRVKEEIFAMIKWWLDKGIDGFRMDVINLIGKAEGLHDSVRPDSSERWANQPLTHQILREMNQELLSKYDIMTIGETPFVNPEIGSLYVRKEREELNMIFHFEHVTLPDLSGENLLKFKHIQQKWYSLINHQGWLSQYLANHDQPRPVSKYGDDREYHQQSAKLLATMLLTLPGTPFIYQGEEIGMTNVAFQAIEDYNDIRMLNQYKEEVGRGSNPAEVFKKLQPLSRDNSRTPMQWDDTANAGFTTGTPWLRVNPNYREINVRAARAKADSILHYYQQLITFRKNNWPLIYGDYILLLEEDTRVYCYLRKYQAQLILVVLNFSGEEVSVTPELAIPLAGFKPLFGNYSLPKSCAKIDTICLLPYEARVYSS